MDAYIAGWSRYGLALSIVLIMVSVTNAANFRTRNFLIQAPSPSLAKAVGEAAEKYRDDLAEYWTGQVLPPWPAPCPVRVVAGPNLAAQGVTTYNPAPVRDFQMEVIGTPERILDSVLPHEVTHTVLATYFGRPLPRWADEGICTTVEHVSERSKHEAKLREFLGSRRGIAMNRLFLLTEYPQDVLPMYAQGYSVCRFLIEQQGPTTFISFLKDYMSRPSWTANVQKHYGYESLAELQQYWLSWVESGSGPVAQFAKADIRRQDSATTTDASSSARVDSRVEPATRLAASGSISRPTNRSSEPQDAWVSEEANSLVAANDRGRISEQATGDSWYHRRAQGVSAQGVSAEGIQSNGTASDQLARTNAAATPMNSFAANSDLEQLPPGNRIAAIDTTRGQVATVSASTAVAGKDATSPNVRSGSNATWAPPSVLSSGRYSVSTPQSESAASFRGDILDSSRRQLDSGRNSGRANGSVWR